MLRIAFLTCLAVAMVTGQGFSDDNEETWSYQWYTDETFTFRCNSSALSVTPGDYVEWETPGSLIVKDGDDTDDYKVTSKDGVPGLELEIKRLRAETHGVYICRIYNSADDAQRRQTIFAINMKGHKYDQLFDKYSHNLVVAVVSSAVFLAVLVGPCLLFHFRYRTPEDRIRKQQKRDGKEKYSYTISGSGGMEMQQTYPDGLAEKVQSEEGRGAYSNPNLSTQL